MFDDHTDSAVVALVARFYARALSFPYDELTHELQNLFREAEKQIDNDRDNQLAGRLLDIINFYQGEDMSALQAEFARMFTPKPENNNPVPLAVSELLPATDTLPLMDDLYDSGLFFEYEGVPDAINNVLDLFSALLDQGENGRASELWETYLRDGLWLFAQHLNRSSTLNFYREIARGGQELVQLL